MVAQTKSYAEQTPEERIASLDRMQNVFACADWRELYLRFADDAAAFRQQMENAPDWDHFIAARALYLHTRDYLMRLREIVKNEKEDLEGDLLVPGAMPPTDYELD